MAAFSFETITADQASAFGADDYLFFIDSNATSHSVQVTPFTRGSLGTGITLTFGGKSVTFPNTISQASLANHIQFNDNTHLQIGTQATDAAFVPIGGNGTTGTQINTVYALNGDDTINFQGTTNGTTTTPATGTGTANYLNGGFGSDTINGGAGNNHIYGNSEFSQVGDRDENNAPDGNDTITVTTGTNFINGNAGNDTITVNGGANTNQTGSNVIRGGADDDTVSLNGGGANSVNGNMGNDLIVAGGSFTRTGATTATTGNATFNNTLRGGQGNDTILAGHGHDQLFGDIGADSLVAGTNTTGTNGTNSNGGHLTVMTGGDGGDVFDFSAAGAATGTNADGTASGTLGTNIAGTTYYQQITDFAHGVDQIRLGFSIEAGDLVHQQDGTSFTTVAAASNYAQGLLANHTASGGTNSGEIAAIQVGSDTYLFYHAAGGDNGTIDSVIQLHNVQQSTLAQGAANSGVANGGNDFIFTASNGTSGGQ